MKLVNIPTDTLRLERDTAKKLAKQNETPWWRVPSDAIPAQAILARSTGRGLIKEGETVYLIHGHDRTVFLGNDNIKTDVYEYVGLVHGTGWQPLVQLGRDVCMV